MMAVPGYEEGRGGVGGRRLPSRRRHALMEEGAPHRPATIALFYPLQIVSPTHVDADEGKGGGSGGGLQGGEELLHCRHRVARQPRPELRPQPLRPPQH